MGVTDPPPPASLSGSTARVGTSPGRRSKSGPAGKDPSAKFWSTSRLQVARIVDIVVRHRRFVNYGSDVVNYGSTLGSLVSNWLGCFDRLNRRFNIRVLEPWYRSGGTGMRPQVMVSVVKPLGRSMLHGSSAIAAARPVATSVPSSAQSSAGTMAPGCRREALDLHDILPPSDHGTPAGGHDPRTGLWACAHVRPAVRSRRRSRLLHLTWAAMNRLARARRRVSGRRASHACAVAWSRGPRKLR